jgi:class 3 adenylate cyclase/tetratricopeptide (TPR) repeat protein
MAAPAAPGPRLVAPGHQSYTPDMAVSRRTVTVLFADVADSTPLGERLDPESLRRVMTRFFEQMSLVLERHGGTVEKFIGDAVMAVFGIPELHEDDALRAVRAATELRQALSELNAELEHDQGVRIGIRVGVNTGEVVAGDGSGGQMLVTGDAVNVAKRLEESARTGEILVGEPTRRLVENAVVLEPRDELELKGKTGRLNAWNVLAVIEGASAYARRLDAPLIGRTAELRTLRETYDDAVATRKCRLFTIVGPAGMGKSRLTAELCASVRDEATVLTGRCLPYGDGITFWPLVGIVDALGSDEGVHEALAGVEDGELIAARVLGAVRPTGTAASGGETFWAVRRLFEEVARKQALLVVVEDIHWAEPTLLDLLEYLAGWTHDAPLLLLCLARPDVLDERPTWLTQPASGLLLDPLSEEESHELLDEIAREWPLDAAARQRIAEAAEGNPLYLEQMTAMLAEGGPPDAIPPSIHALIAARLDRLPTQERDVLESAAVAGREFTRLALQNLSPEDDQATIDASLLNLARRDLLTARPGREDAYRFRHVLIRDAAYTGIAKERRAVLHERFADWAVSTPTGRSGDVDEIIGYHFEQAFRYREQLAPVDEPARALAKRGADILARAGRRALRRRDIPAAVTLLDRAAALLGRDDPSRRELLLDLSRSQREAGNLTNADDSLREAAELAEAAGDRLVHGRILLEQAGLHAYTYPERGTHVLMETADAVIPSFQELGYSAGLAQAWLLVAEAHWLRCQIGAMEAALDRAGAEVAEGAGIEPALIGNARARAALAGPLPVAEALERCREIGARATGDRSLEAVIGAVSGVLEAMRGDFDAGRQHYRESHAILRDLGQTVSLAALQTWSGAVELLAGDPAAAERELRSAFETLEPMGEKTNLSTIAASLAAALHLQGRNDEAEQLTAMSARLTSEDDFTTQIAWRVARARVLAAQGVGTEAKSLAHEAIELAEQTDCPNLRGDAWLSLAHAHAGAAELDEARRAAASAREQFLAKGNTVMAERSTAIGDYARAAAGTTSG